MRPTDNRHAKAGVGDDNVQYQYGHGGDGEIESGSTAHQLSGTAAIAHETPKNPKKLIKHAPYLDGWLFQRVPDPQDAFVARLVTTPTCSSIHKKVYEIVKPGVLTRPWALDSGMQTGNPWPGRAARIEE